MIIMFFVQWDAGHVCSVNHHTDRTDSVIVHVIKTRRLYKCSHQISARTLSH